jgi:hypothetical protein
VRDLNQAARFGVLLALQYDRRRQDPPLLRFLLREEIAFNRLDVWDGDSDLTLAGFLVAEHRQVEDLWLHWTAKNIDFDTALGYDLDHLLTGGVAASHRDSASQLPSRPRPHPGGDHLQLPYRCSRRRVARSATGPVPCRPARRGSPVVGLLRRTSRRS